MSVKINTTTTISLLWRLWHHEQDMRRLKQRRQFHYRGGIDENETGGAIESLVANCKYYIDFICVTVIAHCIHFTVVKFEGGSA